MSRTILSAASLLFRPQYENTGYLAGLIDEAGRRSSDLLVLPEIRFEAGDALTELLCRKAAEHRMHVVAALRDRREGEPVRSYALLIDRKGRIAGRYDQSHRMPEEDIALGDALPVFPTEIGPIGMTIGSDRRFFEVYGVLARLGARIITWSGYPEPVRDCFSDDVVWRARAMDYNVVLALSSYADDLPFFPQGVTHGVPGTPIGRGRILDRGGLAVADTGHEEGIATAWIDAERRKRAIVDQRTRAGLPPYARPAAPLWLLNYFSRREGFLPLVRIPAGPPPRPAGLRTVRVCVQSLFQKNSWKAGVTPDFLLAKIAETAAFRPDLVVCSEQNADLREPATQAAMESVSALARRLHSHIVVGGIRPGTHPSLGVVWDRDGRIVARIPISWTGEAEPFRVLELDFGKLGVRVCGDTEFPEIDRALALQGAEIIVDPSQMWAPGGWNLETLAAARAIDNGVHVVCSHWTLSDPSLRSFVMDPYGKVLAATRHGEDDTACAVIVLGKERTRYTGDPEKVRCRATAEYMDCYAAEGPIESSEDYWRTLFRQRRPELYGPLVREDESSLSGPMP